MEQLFPCKNGHTNTDLRGERYEEWNLDGGKGEMRDKPYLLKGIYPITPTHTMFANIAVGTDRIAVDLSMIWA